MSKASITHQVLTDDDGSGTTGTVLNNALFDTIQDNIDTALAQVIQTKIATYTLDALDDLVLFSTAGATLNLPAVNSVGNKTFAVINAAVTGIVTIDPNSTELIDGASTAALGPGEGVIFKSSGTAWFVLARRGGAVGFTPTVTFGGGATGLTYTTQQGLAWKDGREVNFTCRVTLSAKGSSTGAAVIGGLPYTNDGTFNFSVRIGHYNNMSAATAITGYTQAGATTVQLTIPGAASAANATEANFTNTSDLIITGMYLTA